MIKNELCLEGASKQFFFHNITPKKRTQCYVLP